MSDRSFDRIGIAGVGLIGGSIALAARRALPGVSILGFDPDAAGAAARVVDRVVPSLADLRDTDLIVVSVPVDGIRSTLEALGRTSTEALVTDVGSTKRSVMAAATGLRAFVGGHPMAGSERAGLDSARADLFVDRPWLLVRGSAAAVDEARLDQFVRTLGARPRWITADEHDRVVAYVSHLPQILAAALMNAADRAVAGTGPEVAGRAFAEMTRLASSPPAMWASVLGDNADFAGEALAAVIAALPRDPARLADWIRDALAESGHARDRWRQAADRPA
jgi:prephenate dehydrogenase